jgi:type II secretory pathway component PulF
VSLDIELPLTTRILLSISTFLQAWGIYVIFACIVSIGGFLFARTKIYMLHYATDYWLLRIPIAGEIARSYNVSNFCRTLGLLLHSGVHVTEALELTASITKNVVYRQAYENIAKEVLKGESISSHIKTGTVVFPDLLSHMIAIGETSGSLTKTLRYVASLYETEVDEKTKNLSSTIEPVLLVVMGLIVGLIAVSVITPVYDITKNLQR